MFGPTDTLNLWAPYTTVMNKITGQRHISSVIVKVKDNVMPLMAEKNLTALLTARHGKTDFFTVNTDSIKKTIESTTGTMALLISGIALISLVVGGIGVMNIMLVSVTERTREIGLRMAIGAKQGNIMEQFLIEAVLICVIGGVLGIVVSYLIGVVFDLLVSNFAMSYSAGSMLLALVCSSAIGIVFGSCPRGTPPPQPYRRAFEGMMNAIRLFAALLVLGLGGCANYPMGSLKTDLLPAEDVAASYSLNTAWWKGYHDADLDRIVALALERNDRPRPERHQG